VRATNVSFRRYNPHPDPCREEGRGEGEAAVILRFASTRGRDPCRLLGDELPEPVGDRAVRRVAQPRRDQSAHRLMESNEAGGKIVVRL
jgi:hypothetical protein